VSDPRPLAEGLSEALATLQRAQAKHAAWIKTPEGQAHEAHVKAQIAARARRELAALADERDVPLEVGLRAVALDPAPAATRALDYVRGALDWRARSRAEDGTPAPFVRVLSGPPGCGKSCAGAWAVVRHPRRARYVASATVVATPRNGWSANEALWQAWEAADLLFVDEAGFEVGDPALLVVLLATRYNAGRATLVATNLGRKDWDARFPGERLRDRLENGQEHGGAKTGLRWFATLKGASLRNPAARAALLAGGAK
jgi:hypothetical protein